MKASSISASLKWLELRHTGPAECFRYEPGSRLNLVTGDNSLGKTFLLDLIWWSLTGTWCEVEALPHHDAGERDPAIKFELNGTPRKSESHVATYDWQGQSWNVKPKRSANGGGIVIYARFNGSFAIWDPARAQHSGTVNDSGNGSVILSPSQVWDGLRSREAQGDQWVCNGMLLDWVRWQTSREEYRDRFNAFCACLDALSPSADEPLKPGKPQRRLKLGSRELPTIEMPYGEVPAQLASAGIQRVLALSYVLVWAWYEHLAIAADLRVKPQQRVVLIVDEVEAHLHPRWQRVIAPALMKVIEALAPNVACQTHLATHSPLVLASVEPSFDEGRDRLHHLRLDGSDVVLEVLPFVKRGCADRWLMSDAFGRTESRPPEAQQAVTEARRLQSLDNPSSSEVVLAHEQLVKQLPEDDEFWPMWVYFAEQHGVKL